MMDCGGLRSWESCLDVVAADDGLEGSLVVRRRRDVQHDVLEGCAVHDHELDVVALLVVAVVDADAGGGAENRLMQTC